MHHLDDQRNGCEQNAVVSVGEEVLCFGHKVIGEVRHFSNYPQGTESSLVICVVSRLPDATDLRMHLLPDVRVTRAQQLLNFVSQVARHFLGRDIRECTQSESDSVHVRVVHVAAQIVVNRQRKRLRSTHFFSEFVTRVRTS